MAATVSAWGKPGAWALDAEDNESELLPQTEEDHSAAETPDFPSLSAGASSKTKKKKPQALSLQEFSAYSSGKPKGLTHDELSALPTGPRERSAEELDRNKLGGGFRSYGGGGRDKQPRRQGSFNRESGHELAPSRADETDDWGANKKPSPNTGSERRERGGVFGDSQSRADEVDNWASNKNSEARRYEKRGGFGMESGDAGSDSSNWGKRKEEEGRRSGGGFDSLRDKRGGMEADSESWGRKREESTRPRLNLQPRTLPVNEEGNNSAVKAKGSSNPFGEARPREEVLKDKAQDVKEIEEKLEGVSVDSAKSVWRMPESLDPPQRAGETEADNDDSENKDCEI
ncbi:eukaryotic translation initiation factor 4B3-like [Salvia splendens]|uniref:eukaryotic translation initiation factor 4B3-like n=1 Tax=Salvia splendens TaxID=180675 RepID=UPI001C27C584|nr:eukaryotic translation initiation factor 4B3-like [Salvia splendens]